MKKENNSFPQHPEVKYLVRGIILLSIAFLVLTALLGALLRLSPFIHISLPYKNLIHAHSHTAFLGWLFLINLALTAYQFNIRLKSQQKILLIADIVILFLLIPFFIIYGYNVLTIVLTTIHIFISSYLAWQLIKSSGSGNVFVFRGFKSYFALAWVFMIISGIFPLFLGLIIKSYGSGSTAYYNIIYSYLHFQYNGFFVSMVLGLIHRFVPVEHESAPIMRVIYYGFGLSVVFSLFNSYLWCKPEKIYYYVSIAAIALQLCVVLLMFLYRDYLTVNRERRFKALAVWVIIALVFKSLMQLVSSFPLMAEILSANRFLIIFYLHFVLLGIITIPVIDTIACITEIVNSRVYKSFIYLFLGTFLITELIIGYKAAVFSFNMPEHSAVLYSLAIISVLFPVSFLVLLFITARKR